MLDFIKEIFASFRQTTLERVKSPVLGAFVFSWLAWNWRAVLTLLFSSESINNRIKYVDSNSGFFTWFLFPIIFTAIICYFLPRINRAIAKCQDEPNQDTMELSLDAKIKIGEKQKKIAELEAKKKLAIKREERWIDDEIELIRSKNSQLEQEVSGLESQLSNANSALSENNIILSKTIDDNKKLESSIKKMQSDNLSLTNLIQSMSKDDNQFDLLDDNKNNKLSELLKTKEKLDKTISQIAYLADENKKLRILLKESSGISNIDNRINQLTQELNNRKNSSSKPKGRNQ